MITFKQYLTEAVIEIDNQILEDAVEPLLKNNGRDFIKLIRSNIKQFKGDSDIEDSHIQEGFKKNTIIKDLDTMEFLFNPFWKK